MTGESFCSFETKSTEGMNSTQSLGGRDEDDEAITLPDNIRALLDGARQSSHQKLLLQDGKANHPETSLSSLDEIVRHDQSYPMSVSVSNAVRQLDNHNPTHADAMRTSCSSLPNTGLRDNYNKDIHLVSPVCAKKKSSVSNYQTGTLEDKSDYCKEPLPAVSRDESTVVHKPQPHDDDCTYYSAVEEASVKDSNMKHGPEEELSAVLKKYQYSKNKPTSTDTTTSSRNKIARAQAQSSSNLFLRMSRQMKTGRRGSIPNPHRRNRIKLHVYDLIPSETVMQLPWGCMFPIGVCFDAVNSGLHSMGTGAYHVGIEVNGVEYSFGACDIPGHTGVFSCIPKRSPGYQFRTTIDFGERPLVMRKTQLKRGGSESQLSEERQMDGRELIKQMATEYMGTDYDLLRKNCVTFASDAAMRLGIEEKEIPSWFRNLCESGALTQDVALQTVEPIQFMLSSCEDYGSLAGKTIEDGFEIITKSDNTLGNGVMVVDTDESNNLAQCTDCAPLGGVRQTLSWAY